jgi:CubicO group peptidase (beta-lactamase class C family)
VSVGRSLAQIAVLLLARLALGAPAAPVDLTQPWSYGEPVDVHLDPVGVEKATLDAAAVARFRALLILRHGRLAVERYYGGTSAETRFDVRSVTKSVLSLLVGQLLQTGELPGIDTAIGGYLDSSYRMDQGDRSVTLRQLLTMTSGYEWSEINGNDYNLWIQSPDHVQFLLDRPQTGPPGPFDYDSAAVHLLGVAVQSATGTYLPTLAEERLFQRIGVTSAAWEVLENDTVNGGSGIQLTAQDLARVGQLMLQQGWSGTEEVVPSSWIAYITAPKFPWRDTDGAQRSVTYGGLWWVADPPFANAFFAWGYGGQFIYVVPSLDLVVVATTDWRNLASDNLTPQAMAQAVLGIIVNDILPAALPSPSLLVVSPPAPVDVAGRP